MQIAPLAAAPLVLPLARDILAAARDTGIFLSRFQQSLVEGKQSSQPAQSSSSQKLLGQIQQLRERWNRILANSAEGVLTPPFRITLQADGSIRFMGEFPPTQAQRALITDPHARQILSQIQKTAGRSIAVSVEPNTNGLRITATLPNTNAA